MLFIAKLRGTRIWLEWHGQGLLETSKQEQKCNLISRDRQSIGKRMAHVFKIVKKKSKTQSGEATPKAGNLHANGSLDLDWGERIRA